MSFARGGPGHPSSRPFDDAAYYLPGTNDNACANTRARQQARPRPHPSAVPDHHRPHNLRALAPQRVLGREGPIADHHLVSQQAALAHGDRLSGAQHRLGPHKGPGTDPHLTGGNHGRPIAQPGARTQQEPPTTTQPKPNTPPDNRPLPQLNTPAPAQAKAEAAKAEAKRNAPARDHKRRQIARRRRRPVTHHHSRPKQVKATNRPGLPLGCSGNASSPLTAHSSV